MEKPHEKVFFNHAWYKQVADSLGARYLHQFKHGGVRFGINGLSILYPVFPSGLVEYDKDSLLELIDDWLEKPWGSSLLRFCTCVDLEQDRILKGRVSYRIHETTVTKISSLQQWNKQGLPSSLIRNLKRAKKSGVSIRVAAKDDAEAVFKLYQNAVERNSGALRYTRKYFEAILSNNSSGLRCMLACIAEECVAMNVASVHGKRAFYLHGGFVSKFTEYRAPDLLMFEAIEWAKSKGAESFDFMSSPSDQAGLIRYKEKWGGVSCPQYTVDVYRSKAALYTFNLAMMGLELKKKIWK